MITALEKGIDRANELQYRRVVMCTDGLRSNNMPWKHAENVALAVMRLHLDSNQGWDPIKEMVVIISPEQDEEHKEKVMGTKPVKPQFQEYLGYTPPDPTRIPEFDKSEQAEAEIRRRAAGTTTECPEIIPQHK